uniref:Nucleophosmin n=1 Tax=Otolemur garnettii TaxID=30611 RepID=H0XJJ8_OTOGA
EGSLIKVTLATLKMSVQPMVSLGVFEITPAVVLWLQCGSGPVDIHEQYLVAVEEDSESEEEEENVKLLSMSRKKSAPRGGNKIPQKKVKLNADEDDDEEEEEEKSSSEEIFMRHYSQKYSKIKQNGKDSKPSTPRSKDQESFKKYKKPKIPSKSDSIEDIKAKMQASIEKGGSLSKVEAKFINYVKNCFWVTDQEAIQELWGKKRNH